LELNMKKSELRQLIRQCITEAMFSHYSIFKFKFRSESQVKDFLERFKEYIKQTTPDHKNENILNVEFNDKFKGYSEIVIKDILDSYHCNILKLANSSIWSVREQLYDFKTSMKEFSLSDAVPILTTEVVRKIGRYLDVDFSKTKSDQLYMGMKTETEHSDLVSDTKPYLMKDWIVFAKIAIAHLRESPNYYDELMKLENK